MKGRNLRLVLEWPVVVYKNEKLRKIALHQALSTAACRLSGTVSTVVKAQHVHNEWKRPE